jgi:two-component system response regulator ResD
MNGETVLLLEDDMMLLKANADYLAMEGYRVLACENERHAWEALQKESPDIMVLDVKLPEGSGLDFCREYQEKYGKGTPALFLSALKKPVDIDAGYEAGGVDYIVKPFRIDRLAMKIRAMLEHTKAVGEAIILGKLRLDCVSNIAYLDGEDLRLMPKEYAVLEYLAHNRNTVIPAEIVYEKVWGHPMNGDENAVKITVSRLRKKLEGSGYTVSSGRGDGYCFEPI